MKDLLEKIKVCYYVFTSKYYAFFSIKRFERPRGSSCYISEEAEKSRSFMECVEEYSREVLLRNLDIRSVIENELGVKLEDYNLSSITTDLVSISITREEPIDELEENLAKILKRKVKIEWKSLK